MKTVRYFVLLLVCYVPSNLCMAQSAFNTCSAAFLGNKMIVDEYTTKGKCSLPAKSTGELTVNTVDLSPTESKAIKQIPFKIAIRDQHTKTLMLYSNDNFKRVSIQNVLTKCRKGDHIVLLTTNTQYALPHNEILVR